MSDSETRIPAPKLPPFTEDERVRAALHFFETMKRRRSIRDFADTAVPREVIEAAIRTAGSAPNGANRQPWHFAAVSDPATKRKIRLGAEDEERAFYSGRASDEWLEALDPLGTDAEKPFLETAPWLIVVFAERHGVAPDGSRIKNYYVQESVGIATGFLLASLHLAGLATLTHTPSPMGFLNDICGRPENEKPEMIVVTGHAQDGATVPAAAAEKKALEDIASFL